MLEQYSRLKDFPNYAVSNYGNVLNIKTGKNKMYKIDEGYKRLTLYHNNKPKTLNIHRLVCEAFLENTNNLPIADHIDRDTLNNRLDNLRWVSISQNSRNIEKRGHIRKSNKNSWRVMITTNNFKIDKSFKSFEEAEKYLKEKIKEYDADIKVN